MVYLLWVRDPVNDDNDDMVIPFANKESLIHGLGNLDELFDTDVTIDPDTILAIVDGSHIIVGDYEFWVENKEPIRLREPLHQPTELTASEAGIVHAILKHTRENNMPHPSTGMMANIWTNMLDPIIEKTKAR